jgi:hypothetical protein
MGKFQSTKEVDYKQIQVKLSNLKRILAGENWYFIYNFTGPKIRWQNFNSTNDFARISEWYKKWGASSAISSVCEVKLTQSENQISLQFTSIDFFKRKGIEEVNYFYFSEGPTTPTT